MPHVARAKVKPSDVPLLRALPAIRRQAAEQVYNRSWAQITNDMRAGKIRYHKLGCSTSSPVLLCVADLEREYAFDPPATIEA